MFDEKGTKGFCPYWDSGIIKFPITCYRTYSTLEDIIFGFLIEKNIAYNQEIMIT